ncbi:MAG: spore maturation protein [Crocinitomicaceae bacterium]|nr:spore maturation protein [Crocinitomicaceae bacterium]MBK8924579.1 spore maturation protein [Crocinitomicaceae bacterium]
MILNYIWIAFFLIALVVAVIKTFGGDTEVFVQMVNGTFESAKTSFDISIGLTGILCLWMGIMKIGEMGGSVQVMSKIVGPFFNKLFPDVPANHPARGSMLMNFSANMLGLDNAATPVGLKAMNELQELNPKKDTASNSQIMFLVLNASGLTLIPVTIMSYRSTFGAEDPSDVFIPILIATFCSTLVGLITVAIYQRINLLNPTVLIYLGVMTGAVIGLGYYFDSLSPQELKVQSGLLSNIILYGIICAFILMALIKKVNVYEAFIDGAKDGFGIAIKIIPFLVAIIVSIGVFRTSGAMGFLMSGFEWFFSLFFASVEFVHALPTAIMKPLSGSGARGMMLESFQIHGVDSFIGRLNAVMQGASDTTFYIVAVYFGSVGIKKTRYAIKAGLLADLAGVVTAIIVAYMWFDPGNKQTTPIETVQAFNHAWENHQPSTAAPFIDENCFVIDNAYDTIYSGPQEIIERMLAPDSSNNTLIQTIHLNELEEDDQEHIFTKYNFSKDSVTFTEAYDFTVANGKIKSIRFLGIAK